VSRFRARAFPGFVVQEGHCSVHAEAGFGTAFAPLRLNLPKKL
jgi:hypothetical protein